MSNQDNPSNAKSDTEKYVDEAAEFENKVADAANHKETPPEKSHVVSDGDSYLTQIEKLRANQKPSRDNTLQPSDDATDLFTQDGNPTADEGEYFATDEDIKDNNPSDAEDDFYEPDNDALDADNNPDKIPSNDEPIDEDEGDNDAVTDDTSALSSKAAQKATDETEHDEVTGDNKLTVSEAPKDFGRQDVDHQTGVNTVDDDEYTSDNQLTAAELAQHQQEPSALTQLLGDETQDDLVESQREYQDYLHDHVLSFEEFVQAYVSIKIDPQTVALDDHPLDINGGVIDDKLWAKPLAFPQIKVRLTFHLTDDDALSFVVTSQEIPLVAMSLYQSYRFGHQNK